jgi:hypothetical protein
MREGWSQGISDTQDIRDNVGVSKDTNNTYQLSERTKERKGKRTTIELCFCVSVDGGRTIQGVRVQGIFI